MSPAEQEWGESIAKSARSVTLIFPELNHPNWAVVVTHSALRIAELFEKFLQGTAADIKDAPTEKPIRPILTTPCKRARQCSSYQTLKSKTRRRTRTARTSSGK